RDGTGALVFEAVNVGAPFEAPVSSSGGNKQIYIEGALDYRRSFAKHNVGGMFLYYQKDDQLSGESLAYRKQAWVGRGTYNFDNRYILEGNFSVTGSEQFAPGYRYGFFPALGLAWNITNEPYFPGAYKNVVSGLKLRASIGKTGNDNTGGNRFMYRSTIETAEYSYGLGITS